MPTDSLGNAVTLQQASSLPALNDFVEGVIACEARCVNVFQVAATDHSAIVQACCAALQLFGESKSASNAAAPFLHRAQAALAADTQVSQRERRFVAAIAAWAAGDITRAHQLHSEQAEAFPRDLVSLKIGQYHCFNQGDSPLCCGWRWQRKPRRPMYLTFTACWLSAMNSATSSTWQKQRPDAA